MKDTVLPPNPSLLGYIMTTVLLTLTMLLTISLGWIWYQHIQNFAGPGLSIAAGLVRKSWCYGKSSSHSAVDVANHESFTDETELEPISGPVEESQELV